MYGIGTTELIIIFLIVLILFGSAKLPQLGRSMGTFISEFKESVKQKDDTEKKDDEEKKQA